MFPRERQSASRAQTSFRADFSVVGERSVVKTCLSLGRDIQLLITLLVGSPECRSVSYSLGSSAGPRPVDLLLLGDIMSPAVL